MLKKRQITIDNQYSDYYKIPVAALQMLAKNPNKLVYTVRMHDRITTLIFAKNNEEDIPEAIASAQALHGTILIIDIGSRDDTASVARRLGATVMTVKSVEYVEPARAAGIAAVKTPWVFILDADERMTEELAGEILSTIHDTTHSYFKVPRKNIFARRRWLRHGGWWPDEQMRLIRTDSIKDWPSRIHSTPHIEGTMGRLKKPFLHFFHGDFATMTTKTVKYERIEAELLHQAGRPSSVLTCMRKFAGELWRRLIRDQGYKDGMLGYLEAVYQAYSKTVTYLFVYELQHASKPPPHMNDTSTPKRALLYDPYLDVLGGGEQHMLFVLKALEERGYTVEIASDDPSIEEAITDKFGIRYQALTWNKTLFHAPINPLTRAHKLRAYDVLLVITDGSYFLSGATHTLLYAMVPKQSLYPHTLTDRIKTANWQILANSEFTRSWLTAWGHKATLHYPCISPDSLALFKPEKKEPLILSVGRFFSQLHSKKHKELVMAFQKLKKEPAFSQYRLILAGGLKAEDQAYFDELVALVGGDSSIQLLPNCSFTTLQSLYTKARYFWHFTGMGVDATTHPEQVEHLGITPLEAMAAGCITCCVASGGPAEIITNTTDGFLFQTETELLTLMSKYTDATTLATMAHKAHERVQQTFSYEAFTKRLPQELGI